MKDRLRIYTGDSLLEIPEDKAQPIVEDFLFENDYVMISAQPKMCKSILVQQLACCLSSGIPFLDTFDIPEPVMVWYFATEGKDNDIKDRLARINEAYPLTKDNIILFCSAGFRFNTPEAEDKIDLLVETYKDKLPKVIIIDALYRAVKGTLKDDDVVNEFHETVGRLADICDAAVILVHHMKKPSRMADGQYMSMSDDDSFGSAFLKAAMDHIYWIEHCRKTKGVKILRCDTQRSGRIIEDVAIELKEPNPLCLVPVSIYTEECNRILACLIDKPDGLTIRDIMKACQIGRSVAYMAIKELLKRGRITKVGNKEKLYILSPTIYPL